MAKEIKEKAKHQHPDCLGVSLVGADVFCLCFLLLYVWEYINEEKSEVDNLSQDGGESKMQW